MAAFPYMIIIAILAISLCALYQKKDFSPLNIGQEAPDFCLQSDTGAWVKLSDYKGKNIVLYFYPKDNTPGCTQQACSFIKVQPEYEQHDIIVLGVNYDTVKSHKKFKDRHKLPYLLLSDTTKKVAKLYGAYTGIQHELFPRRITFLIDMRGIIVRIIENVTI